jgi:chromosome segregation ATPase
MDMGSIDLSSMPWWAGLLAITVTSLLTYLGTRNTSKDKAQTDLLTQTVQRQEALDLAQQTLVDNLQEEVKRFRDEILQIRNELFEERKKSETIEKKMVDLESENAVLRKENKELKVLVNELKTELERVKKDGV